MTSQQQHDVPSAKHRYTNLAAAFSLVAGLLFIIGMVTFGSAVEKKASPAVHALAATPVAAAVASGVIAAVHAGRRPPSSSPRRARMGRRARGKGPFDRHRQHDVLSENEPPTVAGSHLMRKSGPEEPRSPASSRARQTALASMIACLLVGGGIGTSAMAWRLDASPAYHVAAAILLVMGLAFGSRSRAAARRVQDETGPLESAACAQGEPARPSLPPVEAERAATRELLQIDRFVRRLYAALAAPGGWKNELLFMLAGGARVDAGACRWWPAGLPAELDAGDLIAGGAAPTLRFAERSRTVHVVGDLAVVISVCDLLEERGASAVVNVIQLRRTEGGWLVEHLASREGALAFSERTADPRPLSVRRGTRA